MTDDAIVCSGLSKQYRRYSTDCPRNFKDLLVRGWRALLPQETLWALRDVDLRVSRGRMLGVIGSNGAGKSTLLRLVGGVSMPDAGTVRVNGRIGALLDLGLGFHPDLTGRENTYVNGVIAGLTRRAVERRLTDIVGFAELEDFIDAPLRTYSTGMRMRLAFAIAAHTDPNVLLIDEVLSVGDLRFKEKCMERIIAFKNQGISALLVSHNLNEVQKLCDDVLWLEAGTVRALGDAKTVTEEYSANTSRLTTPSKRGEPAVQISSTGEPLRLHENRRGTLQLEIVAVRLADRTGRQVESLSSGQPLQVDIEYLPHELIPSPIFQVRLLRDDGLVCWQGSTAASGTVLPDVREPGCLRLVVERQDLAEGIYYVEVRVYRADLSTVYDYHQRVYPLRVHAGRRGKGVMELPVRWEWLGDTGAGGRSEVG